MQEQISMLMNFGFTKTEAEMALEKYPDNLEMAANYLLSLANEQRYKPSLKKPIAKGTNTIIPPVFSKLGFKYKNTCDVTFLIGEEKRPITAHKAIVALYSSAFENKFFSKIKMSEATETVVLEDITVDDFNNFLQYCYTGVISAKDLSSCLNLYLLADKYIVKKLKEALIKPIENLITENNVLTVYELTKNPLLSDFHEVAKSIICKNASKIFQKENLFLNLKKQTIIDWLNLDLKLSEDILLQRILEYVFAPYKKAELSKDELKEIRNKEAAMISLIDINELSQAGVNVALSSGLFRKKDLLMCMLKRKSPN